MISLALILTHLPHIHMQSISHIHITTHTHTHKTLIHSLSLTHFTSIVFNSEEIPPNVTITPISSDSSAANLIIGETNVFYCASSYNLSTQPPNQWRAWWKINGSTKYNIINEDPYCTPTNDTVS